MNISLHQAEIERAYQDLIICPRQRGMLRISRRACALRYLLAQRWKDLYPEDEFGIARKVGLDICRSCPQGRLCAKTIQK